MVRTLAPVDPHRWKENAYSHQLRLQHGSVVYEDASCLRGVAAYANGSVRGTRSRRGVQANARVVQATIRTDAHRHSFHLDARGPPASTMLTVTLAYFRNPPRNWRRIPQVLVRCFRDRSYLWFVATRSIPANTELFIDYHNPANLRLRHRTVPRACH